ncbi:VWA domain-containing protein [Candidatus Villigracilis saccharophilus]|uniref:vWA domain-containing protein n=1 Tax=Candidatus Villigracilis saccharophilus TaxID=3140684 RepID=UPI003137256E|nr:VWA domain-containing protein [Anaerolineales bacterium]
MIKQRFEKILNQSERGQAIILIAFAIVGLVAMVGLVTDTGILLIEYGKLKRGVDAAAVAAAQQYRLSGNVLDQSALENAAINFLQLNQSSDIVEDSVIVHSCESPEGDRPALCNPDPVNNPNDNRKLVEVIASKTVHFGFLRVIGINQTTVTANAVGEAATIDMVVVIDNSGSMAYETSASPGGNDPSTCNPTNTCQPMRVVKDTALDFLDTLYFPYDRVAVVTMTSPSDRDPVEVLPLTSNKADIVDAINSIQVFEPRNCDWNNPTEGSCLFYDPNGIFLGEVCEIYETNPDPATRDPSSCPSSNIGGALKLARVAFTEDPAHTRLDAFWVVVSLIGGPANATDATELHPNGFCPPNTWQRLPWCRDRQPTVRHASDDPLVAYDNPLPIPDNDHTTINISLYDPDDYARDMADDLATTISGEGVTIFTIGLGAAIKNTTYSDDYYPDGVTKIPPAEDLLMYIAACAGEASPDDCATPITTPVINHGQYFYAPNNLALADIFDRIAKNIATKISQ